MREHDLGSEPITRLFWAYTVPAVIGMIVFSLYSITDGIFVSRYVGADALAAVSLSAPVLIFFSCVSIVVGSGGNTAIAVCLGKQDRAEASRLFSMALTALLAFTAALCLLLVLFAAPLAVAMGAEGRTLVLTTQYTRLCGVFCPSFMLSSFLFLILDTVGKPSAAMVGSLISSLGNILLDLIFVAVFKMGVPGAALASGLSAAAATAYCAVKLRGGDAVLSFFPTRIEWKELGDMLFNGLSEGLGAVSTGLVLLLYNHAIITRVGTTGLAAFSIVSYCFSFLGSVMDGAAEGLNPIISYNYGARSRIRIKETLKVFGIANIVIAAGSIAVLLLFRDGLIALFGVDDPAAAELAKSISVIYSTVFLFKGLNDMGIMYFTSITDAKTSAILAAVRTLLLRGTLILLLPPILGDTGIWLVTPISEATTLAICAVCVARSVQTLFASGQSAANASNER